MCLFNKNQFSYFDFFFSMLITKKLAIDCHEGKLVHFSNANQMAKSGHWLP
jgi:hypothetical protein